MKSKLKYINCVKAAAFGWLKAAVVCTGLLCLSLKVNAQSPGGVSANLTSWFKANTATVGNILPNTGNNTPVNEWKSELGNMRVTQGITTNMPLFLADYTTTANFNFNPALQFAASQKKGLLNTAASSPDLLGNNGTYFLVLNTTREAGVTSSTCFSYNSGATGARYQAKADFRIQTGVSGFGYIADLDPASTGLNAAGIPAITYPRASAVMLVSRSAGATFRARRNADTTVLGSGSIYNPAIGTGLGIGFNSPGGSEASASAIAEVITYNTYLSDADINKVETYLAVKYGITLSQSNSFTVPAGPTNYISGNGAVIWNASNNTGYGKCITGIGRDDVSGLMQKQSKSVHDSSLIYLFNANTAGVFPAMNVNNSTAFSSGNSFLLFGDNGLSRELTTCIYNGKITRMPRVWKVQKTGTIGVVTLAVDVTAVNTGVKNLLVSTDPLFPESTTTIYPLSTAKGKLYTAVTLNNNEYFTFASDSLKVGMAITQPTCAIPNGGAVTTTVTGGVSPLTFNWNTTPVQTSANASGLSGGNYQLTVRAATGCAAVYPVTMVTPAFQGAASFTVSESLVCEGAIITVNFTGSTPNTATADWSWGGGIVQSGSGFGPYTVKYDKNAIMGLTVKDGSCVAVAPSQVINVVPAPVAAFVADKNAGCFPLVVTFTDQSQSADAWKWSFGDGGIATDKSPSYTYNKSGIFSVTLIVSSQGMCFDTLERTDLVQLETWPVAAFTVTPAENTPVELHQADFSFSNGSQNANGYQWNFGDGSTSTVANPSHQYQAPGNFIVTLRAMNDIGCADTAVRQFLMVILDKVLIIPNVFSPNGDGINDRWEIAGLRSVTDCHVEIFDRWGQSIYNSNGYSNPWDGTRKGKPLPVATYYYIIKTATRNYNGWVALVR
jgi:gliding motility-associated-like protein